MASEPNGSAPTAVVDKDAALVVNGSADGDVIPNGVGTSMNEVTAPLSHDQVASTGAVEYMASSLNLLTVAS